MYSVLRLRGERDRGRIRTLLDRSASSQGILAIALLVLFFAGLASSFMGINWWTSGRLWLWASLAVLIVTVIGMTMFGVTYMNDLRIAVGRPTTRERKPKPGEDRPAAPPEADDATLQTLQASPRGLYTAVIGFVGLVALIWLMVAKPF